MSQKGFTLVELIAMLVVMGVLMAITIPNISGIIKNNRESIGIEDVNKMVGNAQQKMESKKAKYPKNVNDCVVFSLKYLDTNDDFKQGVNGGEYDKEESIIVVAKKRITDITNEYKYYIRLVELKNNKFYVINFVDYDDFAANPEKYTSKVMNMQESDKLKVETSTKAQLKTKLEVLKDKEGTAVCNTVAEIYSS